MEPPGWYKDWTVLPLLLIDWSQTLKSIHSLKMHVRIPPFPQLSVGFSCGFFFPDSQYKSYYPQYHQPFEMLLGKPLYLEVRLLNTPDPGLVLLVHFCVAYPRSGKAVWLILYNGYV